MTEHTQAQHGKAVLQHGKAVLQHGKSKEGKNEEYSVLQHGKDERDKKGKKAVHQQQNATANQIPTSDDEMTEVEVIYDHKLTFDVTKADSLLEWKFSSKDFDVGFGVFFLDGDKERKVVRDSSAILATSVTQKEWDVNCAHIYLYVISCLVWG